MHLQPGRDVSHVPWSGPASQRQPESAPSATPTRGPHTPRPRQRTRAERESRRAVQLRGCASALLSRVARLALDLSFLDAAAAHARRLRLLAPVPRRTSNSRSIHLVSPSIMQRQVVSATASRHVDARSSPSLRPPNSAPDAQERSGRASLRGFSARAHQPEGGSPEGASYCLRARGRPAWVSTRGPMRASTKFAQVAHEVATPPPCLESSVPRAGRLRSSLYPPAVQSAWDGRLGRRTFLSSCLVS
ncbi:hypothetical protein BV20DRAFT_751208 [Pilatotrama ljubarskyi]|nr:hypothetical protein BV20DRAFT_751208 [Pilatotrama ljubarskyi]